VSSGSRISNLLFLPFPKLPLSTVLWDPSIAAPHPCLAVLFFVSTEGTQDRQLEQRVPLNGSTRKQHAISMKSGPRCWRRTSARRLILDRSTDRRCWRPSDDSEEDRGAIEPIGAFFSVISHLLRLTLACVFRQPSTRASCQFGMVSLKVGGHLWSVIISCILLVVV
jgi:hypothetical protein